MVANWLLETVLQKFRPPSDRVTLASILTSIRVTQKKKSLGHSFNVPGIFLVALGTSLPDTFASILAIKGDETADNAVTHMFDVQHTATHCNRLQHTATHCNTLQHTATHYNTLQHTAHTYVSCATFFLYTCVCAKPTHVCELNTRAICHALYTCVCDMTPAYVWHASVLYVRDSCAKETYINQKRLTKETYINQKRRARHIRVAGARYS